MNKTKEKTYFKAKDLNLIMIIVSFIVFAFLLFYSTLSVARLNQFKRSLTKASVFRSSSLKIRETSNYLTDQARLFTVTGDIQYVKNYFTERNETRKRNSALKELGNVFSYDEIEFKKLSTAFALSQSLSEIEMYAMKLLFQTGRFDEEEIPDEIKEITLRQKDETLPKDQLQKHAINLLFDSSYLIYKMRIDENCSFLISMIENSNEQEVSDNFEVLREKIFWQVITQIIIFVILVIVFIINIIFIIAPINSYMRSIASDSKLMETGSFELRCLAKTYNQFFDLKAANEKRLKLHAETDPLTGLLNRRAFEDVCNDFSSSTRRVVFLIVDVDNFKSVNDTYGHITGDKVLKIVAKELTEAFRTSDFIARLGGDEFGVLLTDFWGNANITVKNKINKVNRKLLQMTEFGRVSLSVGAAKSDSGYTEDLVEKADKALYKTKEEGKCGFNIFVK